MVDAQKQVEVAVEAQPAPRLDCGVRAQEVVAVVKEVEKLQPFKADHVVQQDRRLYVQERALELFTQLFADFVVKYGELYATVLAKLA